MEEQGMEAIKDMNTAVNIMYVVHSSSKVS
jgi:hypothetical protein